MKSKDICLEALVETEGASEVIRRKTRGKEEENVQKGASAEA